ncbi:MAG: hypothetical protein WDW36_008040 [Sanguina aurantia]
MHAQGTTPTYLSTITGESTLTWQSGLALLAGSSSFVVAFVASVAAYFRDIKHEQDIQEQARRFVVFKAELEDKQRRLVRFENVQELMKQYKKPLLQSAFDLQSRLVNQIRGNFLHDFMTLRGNERDAKYACLNFAFVIAEFLGWLEVIREEIVFITGAEESISLNALMDAIKFQFTGQTEWQGG